MYSTVQYSTVPDQVCTRSDALYDGRNRQDLSLTGCLAQVSSFPILVVAPQEMPIPSPCRQFGDVSTVSIPWLLFRLRAPTLLPSPPTFQKCFIVWNNTSPRSALCLLVHLDHSQRRFSRINPKSISCAATVRVRSKIDFPV